MISKEQSNETIQLDAWFPHAESEVAISEFETSEDVEVIPTFDSMGLREDLLRGIYAYGE